jgi:glycosyltransferase involved in cell wall biosynthesis
MNLIFFSWEPWDETMRKRSVAFTLALMSEMGLRRALYVNPPLRLPLLFRRRKPGFYYQQLRCVWPRTFGKVTVITPICPLPYQFARLNGFFARLELKVLKMALGLLPFIYVNNNPQAVEIQLAFRDATFTALDMSDDFEQLLSENEAGSEQSAAIRKAVAAAAQQSDVVLAVNAELAARFLQAGERTVVLRNAVALEFFEQARSQPLTAPAALRSLPRPIIGMVGGLDPRTDYDLLHHLGNARPGWSYVFLGARPDRKLIPKELRRLPNLHFIPPVHYAELPHYLGQFSVGIMPYRINALTRMIDPRRAYDYLAAGLPVVSTPVGGVAELGDRVRIASNPVEFLTAIEAALRDNSPERTQQRILYAAKNSWQARARQFATLMLPSADACVTEPLGLSCSPLP